MKSVWLWEKGTFQDPDEHAIREGVLSGFGKELQSFAAHGYELAPDGRRLIPPRTLGHIVRGAVPATVGAIGAMNKEEFKAALSKDYGFTRVFEEYFPDLLTGGFSIRAEK